MIKFPFLFSLSMLFSYLASAQSSFDPQQGIWMMFFNRTEINDKWSIHAEIQDRYYDLSRNNEQLLIRGGLNYHLKKNLWITAGYGYIETYPPEDSSQPTVLEHRIWQQGIYFHNIGRLFVEHRGRLEQRFVGERYRDRIRYRLLVNTPLNKAKMGPKALFVSVYNEVFLHLEDAPYDRNRLYAALGYQFNRSVNLQAGWMAQDVKGKTRGYLQLALFANVLWSAPS